MPDQVMTEASVFTWSRERELVPVYDRLLAHAPQSDCLELIQELYEMKKPVMDDCNELMAAMGVEIPGEFADISIPDDFKEIVTLLHSRETELLERGYLQLDRHLEEPTSRSLMVRVSRKKSKQLELLRKIADRCQIILIVSPEHGHPGHPGQFPPGHPGHHPPGHFPPDHHPPGHFPPGHHPPGFPPHGGALEYVVQPGDTMFLIAQRYGVSLEALIRANPQIRNPDLIFPGDIIRIPTGRAPVSPPHGVPGGRRYVVVHGDTIIIIAGRFGLSPAELIAFNPGLTLESSVTPGQVLMIPAGGAVG